MSAYLANAGIGFDVSKNLAGFPIRLLVIRLFANLDADAGVTVALVRPAHRVFLHRESVLGGLALDDLGNFLLRHFLVSSVFPFGMCIFPYYPRNSKTLCEYTIP